MRLAITLLGCALAVQGCSARAVDDTTPDSGSAPGADAAFSPDEHAAHAARALARLGAWQIPSTGLYAAASWWNSANATTVIARQLHATGDAQWVPVLQTTYERAPSLHPAFLNGFYDDEGWWALAWIEAWDATGDASYLATARAIFEDLASAWDEGACGGGLYWNYRHDYKNAIPNELFLSVAAKLARRVADPVAREAYTTWAKREWEWFRASGMIGPDGTINDGLDIAADGVCTNNGKTVWTYNQGVILGGLTDLAAITGDDAPLAAAGSIAHAALTKLTDAIGVLHDGCEPDCGPDGVQFKGIFVRNLRALHAAAPDARYASFFDTNATAIWTLDRGPNDGLGQVWSGPFDAADPSRQSSAIDALQAAAEVAAGVVPAPRLETADGGAP